MTNIREIGAISSLQTIIHEREWADDLNTLTETFLFEILGDIALLLQARYVVVNTTEKDGLTTEDSPLIYWVDNQEIPYQKFWSIHENALKNLPWRSGLTQEQLAPEEKKLTVLEEKIRATFVEAIRSGNEGKIPLETHGKLLVHNLKKLIAALVNDKTATATTIANNYPTEKL